MTYLEQKHPATRRESFRNCSESIQIAPMPISAWQKSRRPSRNIPRPSRNIKLTAKIDPDYDGVYHEMGLAQARLKLYDDAIASS